MSKQILLINQFDDGEERHIQNVVDETFTTLVSRRNKDIERFQVFIPEDKKRPIILKYDGRNRGSE